MGGAGLFLQGSSVISGSGQCQAPFSGPHWPHLGGQVLNVREQFFLGTEGQVRGVKPTCRVVVASLAVVLELPGAGSEVFLLRRRREPGGGAEPPPSAGAPVPSLSL